MQCSAPVAPVDRTRIAVAPQIVGANACRAERHDARCALAGERGNRGKSGGRALFWLLLLFFIKRDLHDPLDL